MKKKLVKLEAIRGFAAIYVVLHHTFSKGLTIMGKDMSFFFRFGQEAVILFFFLSGFVIQYAYTKSNDKSFSTFFIKRFLRIYIPLLFVFMANYIVYTVDQKNILPFNWPTFFGNIFMLQDISALKPGVICEPLMGNSPLWSLSYEWWFYMIFIFISLNFKKNASLLVYTLSIVAAFTYLFIPNFVNREFMYLIIWWIGADMANLYLDKKEITVKTLRIPIIFLIINILILGLNVKLHHSNATIGISPYLEIRHFLFALAAIGAAILWKKLNWVGFSKTVGLFEPVASISFGIYITHWFLIARAHYLDKFISNQYLALLCYALICVTFSYLIERIWYVKISKYIMSKIHKPKSATLII